MSYVVFRNGSRMYVGHSPRALEGFSGFSVRPIIAEGFIFHMVIKDYEKPKSARRVRKAVERLLSGQPHRGKRREQFTMHIIDSVMQDNVPNFDDLPENEQSHHADRVFRAVRIVHWQKWPIKVAVQMVGYKWPESLENPPLLGTIRWK